MQKRISFNQIATTLAALGAVSLVAGDLAANPLAERVAAHEVPHALDEGNAGDKDKEKDKDARDGDADKDKDKKAPKKKKGKKEGSCGAHGGCGAGSCG